MPSLRNSDEFTRAQQLQACERALTNALGENDAEVLRWFTCSVLCLPWSWRPVVALALLDKSKAGEYRWRNAKIPVALLRRIANRIARRQYPELVYGADATAAPAAQGQAVSRLLIGREPGSRLLAPADDVSSGGGHPHDEFIDFAHFRAEVHDPEIAEACDDLDPKLTGGRLGSNMTGTPSHVASVFPRR
jgi:hypothetical protein